MEVKNWIQIQQKAYKDLRADGQKRGVLISAIGVHVILITGQKSLIYKDFCPVFCSFSTINHQLSWWNMKALASRKILLC